MQHNIISRTIENAHPKIGDAASNVLVDQSQLMILRDHLRVMQKRNVVLIAENESLRDELREESCKSRDLELKCSGLEKEREISTENFKKTEERGVQAWAVCRACERKLEEQGTGEATVVIPKSELESLEKDMQALRDALLIRESDWTRAMEREECYREQLSRSASEAMTARLLADSRYDELDRLARTLAETDKDLKMARKDISGLKKIIAKQEKGQRQTGENASNNAGSVAQMRSISEKEQKWIDDIVRQLSNGKNKHRSRLIKDRVFCSSGKNCNVSRESPRAVAADVDSPISSEEPVTVATILALSK